VNASNFKISEQFDGENFDNFPKMMQFLPVIFAALNGKSNVIIDLLSVHNIISAQPHHPSWPIFFTNF